MLSPVGRSKVSCSQGARMTMPKKPSTTEGIPARSSMTDFRISLIRPGRDLRDVDGGEHPEGHGDQGGEEGHDERADDQRPDPVVRRVVGGIPVAARRESPGRRRCGRWECLPGRGKRRSEPRIRIDTQAKRKKMRLMMISLSLLVMACPRIDSRPGRPVSFFPLACCL